MYDRWWMMLQDLREFLSLVHSGQCRVPLEHATDVLQRFPSLESFKKLNSEGI
jgi:hypothetical protein